MSVSLKSVVFATVLSATNFTVLAHVPYLNPASFEPVRGDWVSLDAAFADRFFLPEAVFDNSAFVVLTPSGQTQVPLSVHYATTRATAEHKVNADGTYRFSTGLRYGAVFHTYELNGERKNSRDPAFVLPAGAKSIAHFQAVTRAETYVSKGAPDHVAVQATGEALELEFLSHPNDLYTDSTVRARVLYNGKPLPHQNVNAYLVAKGANDEQATHQLTSDSTGVISFVPQQQGRYLLVSRYRTAAPNTAEVPTYSYTYSVVLEVTE
ncbi:DUF4198 domain-containing protein [Rheinheimera baltica]|uniref:DUF4198 domain-containing protein n=1 Tax=Rheinheimera baltica TaxID=67576 RepID=UPI00273E6FFC|nr:DUF4198 domain-containing protein [Rheinheimera baltica]MDP5142783.1 DUF4198 domain-containing protein [Rheinheimera baltica]